MDMRFNTTKRRHKKFEPRVRVWKFKEEQSCEEYKSMVRDKVEEEEWEHLDVNEHWHKMKKDNDGYSTAHVECQKALANIRKHGGGMRRLLKH